MALTASLKNKQRTWIEISRKNLRHNLEVFRRLCGNATLIWTVKANAYGHGDILVAKEIEKTIPSFVIPSKTRDLNVSDQSSRFLALDKSTKRARNDESHKEWFGVDSLDEAITLRQAGVKAPIIVLGWVPDARLSELAKNDLRLLVSSAETVAALGKLKNKPRVHLKIDTGTTRQGVLPEGAVRLAERIRAAGLALEGCATHFANIEDTGNPTYGDLQIERFVKTVAELQGRGFGPLMLHAACSAAAMVRPEAIFNACRIGIGLYGLYPSSLVKKEYARAGRAAAVKPALSWHSRVALVKTVEAGTPVGYGLTERTAKKSRVAIVPVGYSDGYDRALSSKGFVAIRGKRCRVIGRICMNMMIVDVTGVKGARPGDEAILLGSGRQAPSAEDLAAASDTINYEIVARLNARIPRFVV